MQTPDNDNRDTDAHTEAAPKVLSPAAQRALKEAEERRAREKPLDLPPELGGRGGADPARFGDWEINGRAIDF
ncbi:hypothetical protein SAMN05880590_11439 [Rhizobium sp. RU35A]|uniref:DUF1674 domain-containing protein n=1 Tax=Rhizobium straminoryzae TaxID=1387186 RepID=A0A549SV34_9HYPH|nr:MULTISPECIES: DUF1674 domain-containing protein [Rhizobium]TRL33496.1 DUF1674 domain-containing protein [Rhizobium straminoryzae]SIR21689.1 hypothetical protein SAMN05880590_11439 [Rhizobium sp. RU35A]